MSPVTSQRWSLCSPSLTIGRFTSTKDKTKVYKDTKKLLVAKPQTFELLTKHAIKRGGWRDARSMRRRVGDKSASVGSMFDFVEKQDIEELKKLYMVERIDPKTNQKVKVTNFTPADYEKEIGTGRAISWPKEIRQGRRYPF